VNRPIELNDFGRQWADVGAAALDAVRIVGESGRYILGCEVAAFERALADALGAEHAVGCASGLDAIEIALRATGARPGDRVLTTPLSAFATTLAILRTGCVPVFSDVDAAGLLDLDRCEEVLAGGGIRFLLPVHLYGHVLDLDRLADLRAHHGIVVVEDLAQAIGASWRGRAAGTVGDAAALSLYPTKNLGAMGDGGVVITGGEAIQNRSRALGDYGQTAKYVHDHRGLNSRLDELQAAILRRASLPRLEGWTARRREIAGTYLRGIVNPCVRPVAAPAGSASVWHLFPVLVDDREAFRRHLEAGGVHSGVHYPRLITEQRALTDGADFEVAGDLHNAAAFAASEVSLPIHPYLTSGEVERIIELVEGWSPP
jgi:dTDP-3-amino-3,4,6-trideoxy-alpha-D-glucose transaminase